MNVNFQLSELRDNVLGLLLTEGLDRKARAPALYQPLLNALGYRSLLF